VAKPHKGIWEQITGFDNLYSAYQSAVKGKRFRSEVLVFSAMLEDNLFSIQDDLCAGTYRVGKYRKLYVYEPKKRIVMALPFRDRVVQWAVYRVINPIFTRSYIEDSYACIDDRGIHSAVKRLQYMARLITDNGKLGAYYLKLDITKYFYRISHDALMSILRRRFADEPLLNLLEQIIRSEETPFGLPEGGKLGESPLIFGLGMPIGNLSSQMFANLYLNELDQYVKRTLKAHFYVRYMDDMIVLASDKATLHKRHGEISAFLSERLQLSLNDKTAIRPLSCGIDYCGYRIWDTHIKLRKSTSLRMRRRLKQLQEQYARGELEWDKVRESLASYNGVLKHCDSFGLSRKIFGVQSETERLDGWFYLQRNTQGDGL
jgi:retron-type reverse transcriptase